MRKSLILVDGSQSITQFEIAIAFGKGRTSYTGGFWRRLKSRFVGVMSLLSCLLAFFGFLHLFLILPYQRESESRGFPNSVKFGHEPKYPSQSAFELKAVVV